MDTRLILEGDLFELKKLWTVYIKKIEKLLPLLASEVINRYDMVVKSLLPPVFDLQLYPADAKFEVIFDEVVYKMA